MNARRLKIISAVIALLVALYALVGFLLAPWLIERYLPGQLTKKLNRDVSIAQIGINPFLLTLEAKGVSVAGQQGDPVLSFERLFADLSVRGLFDKTWVLDRIDLAGLKAHVIRQQDGSVNLIQLAQRFENVDNKSSSHGLPAIVIDVLAVSGARLVFTDLTGTRPAAVVLNPVNLHVSHVSTISGQPASYEIDAALPEDGKLSGKGQLTLQPALSVNGEMKLANLHAGVVWPFVRDTLNLTTAQAVADLSSQFSYSDTRPLQLSELELNLANVLIVRPDETKPLLAMKQIKASGGSVDLERRALILSKLVFKEGETTVSLAPGGGVNWAQLATSAPAKGTDAPAPVSQPKPESKPAAGTSQPDWKAEAEQLQIDNVGFHFLDQSRARSKALAVDVGAITAGLKLTLGFGASTQVLASSADIRLKDISVGQPVAHKPAIKLASARLQAGSLDLHGKRFDAQSLSVEGGQTSVVRDSSGQIALLQTLGLSQGTDGVRADAAPGQKSSGAAPGWSYQLGAASVKDFSLSLADQGFRPPLSYDLTVQALNVKNISGGGHQDSPFDLAIKVKQGGTLKANGSVSLNAKSVKAQLTAVNLALAPMQPLVQRIAALKLQSGTLSTSADICYACLKAASLQASGKLQVSDLLLVEAWSGDRFMSWKQMDADGIAFDLDKRELTVRDVTVNEPGAKIAIAKDRSVNVSQAFKRSGDALKKPGSPKAEAIDKTSKPALNFRADRVRLRNGEVDYADLSLVLPFSTKVTALNGTIVGISNDKSRRADIKANGSIETYGSATVEGSIVPFYPESFTDLHVAFNNVLVPPLSPYTATFAGRKVESGKLWLDLDYKVQDGQLLGKNDIRLADFTLGERVDAPGAMNLPLDLAVALLTDSKGQINLSVPVRGDLENPKFSVGSAVRQVIGNLIQRIVTAPFRAIANLFGGGNSDAMARVDFQAGSAALRPDQREKLDALTKALNDRPKLQLVISAPYDPKADTNALQRLQAERALANALGRSGSALEQSYEPVAFDDPATRRALEGMLASQSGQDAVRKLVGQSQSQSGGDRKVYETMFDRIAASTNVGPGALQVIASQRAQTIASYLQQKGVQPDRLKTGHIVAVEDKGDKSQTAVSAQLQVAAGGPPG